MILVQLVARVLFPAILVTAATLLLVGYESPGGGFAAGVVAASAYVLAAMAFGARVAARMLPERVAWWFMRAGVLLPLAVAFVPPLAGAPLLTHYPRVGEETVHLGVITLHTSLLFEAGIALLVLGFMRVSLLPPRGDA